MKKLAPARARAVIWILILALIGASPALAERGRSRHARPVPSGRSHARPHRPIIIAPHYPIHRSLPPVYVRHPRLAPRVVPRAFLPPLLWHPLVIVRPAPSVLVWEDSASIDRLDGWTDLVLEADARGGALVLDVTSGRVQLEIAEVVFGDGSTQVVDFNGSTLTPGVHPLLDFRDGRLVDHVRLIARARSREARITLLMER